MNIYDESSYAKRNALDAEMCRRLWWALIIFDNRICELSRNQSMILAPAWDCNIPLNVNDYDLRPETKVPPANNERPTETIFAVVRSELGDFVRHSAFHLDFTTPALKNISKESQQGSATEGAELNSLEKTIEDKYFKFCTPENPLHFMTIWTTRVYLAKNRLLEHCSHFLGDTVQQTDSQRDTGVSHALKMLECDTKLMTSPLTKGFIWLVDFHFPFPAYLYLVQDLKRRPTENHTEKTWEVMSDNFEAHCKHLEDLDSPELKLFSRLVLLAWGPREAALRNLDKMPSPPRIISMLLRMSTPSLSNSRDNSPEPYHRGTGKNTEYPRIPTPTNFGGDGVSLGGIGQTSVESSNSGLGIYPDISGQVMMDVDFNQLDWTMVDWNPMITRGW